MNPMREKKDFFSVKFSGTWTQWRKKRISFLSNLVGHEPNEGKKRFLFCQNSGTWRNPKKEKISSCEIRIILKYIHSLWYDRKLFTSMSATHLLFIYNVKDSVEIVPEGIYCWPCLARQRILLCFRFIIEL
jgi:hypothetical protein